MWDVTILSFAIMALEPSSKYGFFARPRLYDEATKQRLAIASVQIQRVGVHIMACSLNLLQIRPTNIKNEQAC